MPLPTEDAGQIRPGGFCRHARFETRDHTLDAKFLTANPLELKRAATDQILLETGTQMA